MNAELVLYLMECGLGLTEAKDVAEQPASNAAELALTLIEVGHTLTDARRIAADAPLVTGPDPSKLVRQSGLAGTEVGQQLSEVAPDAPLRPAPVAPGRPGDIMPHVRRAIERGTALCPNCQQPSDDHLPGCSRVSSNFLPPVDGRAVTKGPLPPASE